MSYTLLPPRKSGFTLIPPVRFTAEDLEEQRLRATRGLPAEEPSLAQRAGRYLMEPVPLTIDPLHGAVDIQVPRFVRAIPEAALLPGYARMLGGGALGELTAQQATTGILQRIAATRALRGAHAAIPKEVPLPPAPRPLPATPPGAIGAPLRALPAPGQAYRPSIVTPAPIPAEEMLLAAQRAENVAVGMLPKGLRTPALPVGITRQRAPTPPPIFSQLRAAPLEQRLDLATRDAGRIARQIAPSPRRPIPPADAQRGALNLQMLDEGMIPTRGFAATAREGYRGAVRQANSVIGGMGSEGTEALARVGRVHSEATLAAGDITGRIHWATRLPEKAWENVRAAREGLALRLTPQEQQLKTIIDGYLGGVVPRARGANLDVGELPNYWPIRLDLDRAGQHTAAAVKAIMERTGASAERAQEIFFRIVDQSRKGRPFGNLERHREHWVPYFIRKPARQEFMEYVRGAERRIAEAKHLGPKDELVEPLLANIRARNPRDGAFAETWFDRVTGRRAVEDTVATDFARQAAGVQVASKMGFSVVSNASQPINNLLVVNARSFARGYKQILDPMTRDEAMDFARRTGAALDSAMREMVGITETAQGMGQRGGEAVLTRTGFLKVEQGNRLISAVIGREWARDLAGQLVKRPADKAIRRHLLKIGLDADEVLRQGGKLTDVQERLAGLTLSDLTQFKAGAGEVPLFWSSPWGRLATQFKVFAYKQGQLVANTIVDEARHGNYRPLAVFLAAFPLVGEAVADARYLLRYTPAEAYRGIRRGEGLGAITRAPGRALAERPATLAGRLAENVSYVGGLGIASDFTRALVARAPKEAARSFLMGPTGTDVADLIGNVGQSYTDIQKLVSGEETSLMGPRSLGRQAMRLTVTPGLTAVAGVPGAMLGKAVEGAPLFRSPLGLRQEMARKLVEADRRGDEKTVARLQQEYYDAYGRFYRVKRPRRQR